MFWQNNKKNRLFDECLAILDFPRKWLLILQVKSKMVAKMATVIF